MASGGGGTAPRRAALPCHLTEQEYLTCRPFECGKKHNLSTRATSTGRDGVRGTQSAAASSSAGASPETSPRPTTPPLVTKLNVDRTLPCDLLSSADIQAVVGRSLARPTRCRSPTARERLRVAIRPHCPPGTGVIFGTGHFTSTARATALTAKGASGCQCRLRSTGWLAWPREPRGGASSSRPQTLSHRSVRTARRDTGFHIR